jgi:hypothetical protein
VKITAVRVEPAHGTDNNDIIGQIPTESPPEKTWKNTSTRTIKSLTGWIDDVPE